MRENVLQHSRNAAQLVGGFYLDAHWPGYLDLIHSTFIHGISFVAGTPILMIAHFAWKKCVWIRRWILKQGNQELNDFFYTVRAIH